MDSVLVHFVSLATDCSEEGVPLCTTEGSTNEIRRPSFLVRRESKRDMILNQQKPPDANYRYYSIFCDLSSSGLATDLAT